MLLEIVKTQDEHYDQIKRGSRYDGDFETTRAAALSLTILNKGQPVAIIGGFLFVPGVLYCWAAISDEVSKCPISFHKTVKHMLRFYMEELKLRRIQIYVRESFDMGAKWAVSLGFSTEGIMANFLPSGEAALLMAVVK